MVVFTKYYFLVLNVYIQNYCLAVLLNEQLLYSYILRAESQILMYHARIYFYNNFGYIKTSQLERKKKYALAVFKQIIIVSRTVC